MSRSHGNTIYFTNPSFLQSLWGVLHTTILRERVIAVGSFFWEGAHTMPFGKKPVPQPASSDFSWDQKSTWDPADASEVWKLTQQGVGQVIDAGPGTLGTFLKELAANPAHKTYLEIGTWNGLGSTQCFRKGFVERGDLAGVRLVSLECNADKCNQAKALYADFPTIEVTHGTVLRVTDLPTNEEMKAEFPGFNERWHVVDIANMAQANYVTERNFDVVFLDGGEFTTYAEYLILKPSSKVIVCDDSMVDKCARIRQELLADPAWELMAENPAERNGWCAFRKI